MDIKWKFLDDKNCTVERHTEQGNVESRTLDTYNLQLQIVSLGAFGKIHNQCRHPPDELRSVCRCFRICFQTLADFSDFDNADIESVASIVIADNTIVPFHMAVAEYLNLLSETGLE